MYIPFTHSTSSLIKLVSDYSCFELAFCPNTLYNMAEYSWTCFTTPQVYLSLDSENTVVRNFFVSIMILVEVVSNEGIYYLSCS